MKGDLEMSGHGPEILMIAQDQGNLHLEFPQLMPHQEIVEAVSILGNEDPNPNGAMAEKNLIIHVKTAGELTILPSKADREAGGRFSSHSILMKKMPVSKSVCWSESTMFPPCRNTKS